MDENRTNTELQASAFCSKCGAALHAEDKICPTCGEKPKKTKKKSKKKVAIFLLIVVILIGIIAIVSNNEPETPSVDSPIVTEQSTTAETTTTKTAVTEKWTKNYYIDDFNEPTDEWYVSYNFNGTFSNSATTDSRLSGYVIIDESDISIMLYEYNNHQVKNIYSHDKEYTVVTRLSDGSEKEFTAAIYPDSDRILFKSSDYSTITDMLKTNETVKVYIYETDNSITNYLFTIESSNLGDILS